MTERRVGRIPAGAPGFGRDEPTPTWGFNGAFLGPTLRATRGEQVKVNVVNLSPGATWSPHWQVDQSAGILGYTMLVNGAPGAFLEVTTERVRLRVVNGSNARVYRFHFDDNRAYAVVASDGGLLPKPVETSELLLSPNESVELRMRFTDFADAKSPYMFRCHLLPPRGPGTHGPVRRRPARRGGRLDPRPRARRPRGQAGDHRQSPQAQRLSREGDQMLYR